MKNLKKIAKAAGGDLEIREGGSHTVVKIGNRQTTVPRHNEINEITAKKILEHMAEDDEEGGE